MGLDPVALIRAEAASCYSSSVGNGEYNTAFHVAGIVLDSLARRLEIAHADAPSGVASAEAALDAALEHLVGVSGDEAQEPHSEP